MSRIQFLPHSLVKLILLVSVLALGACSSGVKLDDVSTSTTSQSKPAASQSTTAAVDQHRDVKTVALDPLTDPANPLSKRSIYFDYDSYTVAPEYKELLAAHARYLIDGPGHTALIQGNTDERGTTEYNLALGQKRAEAVRQALSLFGVKDAQMEAVSLGKEKPRATEHNEAAWRENRRVDIVY